MTQETLILSYHDLEDLIEISMVIEAVERAFRAYEDKTAKMPPKVYLDLPEFSGDFRAMPAQIGEHATIKWVNSHPKNLNLPTVMAVVIYSDCRTGFPLAIMDGTLLTMYRTGAASAVASKYMARKDSKTLGLAGCGAQARTQLLAISHVFDLDAVNVFDLSEDEVRKIMEAHPEVNVIPAPLEKVSACDIIATTTPVRSPIIKREWIREGTHINAVGADAPGKEELDPAIIQDARVVVDEIEQASNGGEINVPLKKGFITRDHIWATLGEVVAGKKSGRENEREITVFDSTGLAIQDAATAELIYNLATKEGRGTWMELVHPAAVA
ncbi:MAG: ornithine cyclodeaminase family protein [Candidatus Syntropharchaeales archaeon]|nr:ornithine cyclodeaminase family protein [Candidatus Syntrophoarchaeum sp.]